MKTRLFSVFALFLILAGSQLAGASEDEMPIRPTPFNFSKVITVVLENTDFSAALRQPFFARLAKSGALLSNFHGVAHPSQPNYLAMVGGSTFGVTNDNNVDINGKNIADLLESNGKSWKVYAEQYPGNCFLGKTSGGYVRKHNPLISFKSTQKDPMRCGKIVDGGQFGRDSRSRNLPDYSFYVPDMSNDGHDTDAAFADAWLAQTFGPLISDPNLMRGILLVVTFDEGDLDQTNHIYTVLYGPGVNAGTVVSTSYDHISVLKTIEEAWALGNLGQKDLAASSVVGVWK